MLKKLIFVCLSLALTFGVIGVNNNLVQEVKAYDFTYAMNCGNYEVATVNDDGGFTSHACVGDFNTAKNKMKELGEDAVVRHGSSKSPTKIIAMVSGSAYSYGYRQGKNTININQYANNTPNMKTTYVTMHREMHYLGTESYDGNGNGTIHINLTGFDGYTQLIGVDLIPTKYTAKEIPIMLGGNGINQYTEQPFQTHIYQMEYVVEQKGNYRDLVFYWYSGWSDSSTYPTKNRHAVGPAADWMATGAKYYSYDGHTFYTDKYYKNLAGTYYNYYQFLPLRTRSNISADVLNRYLETKTNVANSKMAGKGYVFIDGQNNYGVNGLLVYAMACLESAYGTSDIAQKKNNLFGWNAVDSSPNDASYFESVDKGVLEHMGINLRGYLDINDYRFFGTHLGNKGSGINLKYAADPYWGYKIAAIAYDIDKFANGYNGYLSDYNQYALGVINTYGVDIKSKPSSSSSSLYNTKYGATYQKNFMLTLLSEENGFYKTNTTNPLNGSSIISGSDKGLVNYDFNTSVGYIPVEYVTKQNSATISKPAGNVPTGDFTFSVDSLGWNNDKLAISGKAYRPGIMVTGENTIKHVLDLTNMYFEHTTFNLNSSANGDVTTYSGDIDVSGLGVGTYRFKINTEYGKYSEFNKVSDITKDVKGPGEKVIGNKKFNFVVEGNYLKLVVSNYVAPAPKPETPKPERPVLKKQLIQSIGAFKLSEDNKLFIKGNAFIRGIDALDSAKIKHEIIFVNSETNEVIKSYPANTKENKINLGDYYEYKFTGFEVEIDVNEILNAGSGNYNIMLQVTNGEDVLKDNLLNTEWLDMPAIKKVGDNNLRFISNQGYRFRYELLVDNIQLDWNSIKKKTLRNSLFSKINFSLDDDENLTVDAASWIYNINYNDPSKVSYKLMLVNEETGEVYNFDKVAANKCKINYTELMKLSYDYSNACFSSVNSLKDIPDGKYIMYLEMNNGEYHDIVEIADYYDEMQLDVLAKNTNRNFKFTKSSVRERLELTISKVNDSKEAESEINELETAEPVETEPVSTEAAVIEPIVEKQETAVETPKTE